MTTIGASGANGAAVAAGPSLMTSAVCDMTTSTSAVSTPRGSVYFTLVGGVVNIVGRFTGINGTHGLHIHTVRFDVCMQCLLTSGLPVGRPEPR